MNMNMNSNIKCGVSSNGGLVLTDMPIEALKAMRDSIDDAIRKHQEQEKDKYITDILAAIDAARDAGYDVYINRLPYEDADDIELYEHEDDEDEDEDEDDEDDEDEDSSCRCCDSYSCFGCKYYEED